MLTVKNVRPSLVLVSDARLRLGPGQVMTVEQITPQLQTLLDAGALVRLEGQTSSAALTVVQPSVSAVAPTSEDTTGSPPARPEPKRPAESSSRRKAEGTPDAG